VKMDQAAIARYNRVDVSKTVTAPSLGLTEDLDKLKPYISAVDRSAPTPKDKKLTKSLTSFINNENPQADPEETTLRQKVVSDLSILVNSWVVDTLRKKGVPESEAKLGGKLFVSGSYRLGVDTAKDDIDTICAAPRYIDRNDFFSEEEGGFTYRLRKVPGITHVMPIREAVVPIIEVVWHGTDLDVLFAKIERSEVPPLSQILDDSILKGLDDATTKSINGPRVTELLVKLIPNPSTFALVLRCIRLWAKRRGLYSNKMGFLGGVNWAILVAFVCQLFPTASPARLLQKFFSLYQEWKWPTEIRLCHPYEVEDLDMKQWDPTVDRSEKYHVMPIITPAYPCQNSSYNVSHSTLDIMLEEFKRGKEIVKDICDKPWDENRSSDEWAELFVPNEFFLRFGTYVVVQATAADDDMLHAWVGYIESRIRKLVEVLQRAPLRKIFPFPKKVPYTPIEPKVLETTEDAGKSEAKNSLEGKDDSNDAELESKQEESEPKEGVKIATEKSLEVSQTANAEKMEAETKEAIGEEESKTKYTRWYIGILRHPVRSATRKRLDFSWDAKSWVMSLKMWNGYKPEMGAEVKLVKWTDLPDQPEIFPDGKENAITSRKMWVKKIAAEQAEVRAQGIGGSTHHRTWTAKQTPRKGSAKPEEEKSESKEAHNGEEIIDESKVDAGIDSNVINVKGEDEEEQSLLMKRIRDENMMNKMDKKVRVMKNFKDLERVSGYIDTLQPLGL